MRPFELLLAIEWARKKQWVVKSTQIPTCDRHSVNLDGDKSEAHNALFSYTEMDARACHTLSFRVLRDVSPTPCYQLEWSANLRRERENSVENVIVMKPCR